MWLLFLAILISVSAMSIFRWRFTLSAVVIVGFTQDVFRKLIEGEPRIFVIMVGVVFACGLLSLLARKGFQGFTDPFFAWSDDLKYPMIAFFFVLAAQFIHSFVRFGNPVISTIGLLSYIAPFVAVALSYFWASKLDEIRDFFRVYVMLGFLVAASIMLSFQGFDWQIFKEVGVGLKIYDMGTVLFSHAGIMRTGEIAAWHIATCACFMMILFFTANHKASNTILAICVIALMIAIFLTGRRKMFMLFSLYVVFYIFGIAYYRRGVATGYLLAGAAIAFIGWLVVEVVFPGGYGESINNYISRGTTVYTDATGRFIDIGLTPIYWAYNRVGILGGGLGIGSQGSGYYGTVDLAGGSGEGGLGKIMVELGLPGLISILWLGLSGLGYVLKILRLAASQTAEPRWLIFAMGPAILLFVNVLTFSVATQLYGDMFILIMLGIIAGFLLAVPRMIAAQQVPPNTVIRR